jgi:hypothetical protein
MAGDWIKMEHVTPDKPEVFRMALDLGITPEHVLGCLVRLWIWADQQSINGNALTVTCVTLDRITCNAGFANALKNVGWLIGNDMDFTLPNFDRHNGETAKTRANTQKRVAKHRNANTVTGVTPKVLPEKRREDMFTTSDEVVVDSKLSPCPQKAILDAYAELLPTLPQPRMWEGARAKNLTARWRWVLADLAKHEKPHSPEDGLAFFRRMFLYIEKSDLLMGRSGSWNASLDWIVKAENFAKIIQGNYENKE